MEEPAILGMIGYDEGVKAEAESPDPDLDRTAALWENRK
jgi:hypothetical protein